MRRSFAPEILDDPEVSDEVHARAHRGIMLTHRLLGNTRAIAKAIGRDARSVLDLGCGGGGLLAELERRLGVEGIGVDLRVARDAPVRIVRADAVRDPLPACDVAIAVMLAHHLSGRDLTALIRNVGRSCRRLILLDPVRHELPRMLFRVALYPFLYRVNALDGLRSVERSYTAEELRAVVEEALAGAGEYRHTVAPCYIRQVVDIRY